MCENLHMQENHYTSHSTSTTVNHQAEGMLMHLFKGAGGPHPKREIQAGTLNLTSYWHISPTVQYRFLQYYGSDKVLNIF